MLDRIGSCEADITPHKEYDNMDNLENFNTQKNPSLEYVF